MKIVLVIALSLLTGCARYQPRTLTPTLDYQKQIKTELSSSDWLTRYNSLSEATASDLHYKAQERNRLLNEFLWLVDNSYASFEAQFYGVKATEDIASDFLQLGITSAATITNGQRAKTILALAATTAAGGKASIDSHWFNNQSRSAIVAKMRASRVSQLTLIEQGMSETLQAYSLEQGLRDVQAYYQAGTVVGALQAIVSDAGTEVTTSNQKLRLMRESHR